MHMFKGKRFIALIAAFFISLVVTIKGDIQAATEVGSINYASNGGVLVLKGNSLSNTGRYLKANTKWKIFGTYERLNILYYDLGGRQYVPARYLDKTLENSAQKLNAVGKINYRPGYQVISWTSPDADKRVYRGSGYFHGQKVNIIERAVVNGHVWYELTNSRWLDGQYVKLISEKTRNEKTVKPVQNQPQSNKNNISHPNFVQNQTQNINSLENTIINLVNNYRKQNGVQTLIINQGLQTGSLVRANEEIAAISQTGNNNSADHFRLDGTKFSTEPHIRSFGTGAYGENLAIVNGQQGENALAQHFFNLWINSPGHRANILNGRFTATGIKVTRLQNGQYIGMQEFAGR